MIRNFMNINYKLYFSIGLLFSMAAPLASTPVTNNENQSEVQENQNDEQPSVLTQEQCDDLLHDFFENYFFNDNDKTRFSDIVTKLVGILQVKVKSLDAVSQKKCNDFIQLLEKNKNVADLKIWMPILMNPDLLLLLPKRTQDFLKQNPFKKLATLRTRLQNN